MDSEKNTHMRELLLEGRPVTDEGPFYHHAWWESYKGSVKGKLGGGLIGGSLGLLAGAGAVGAMSMLGVVFTGLAIPFTVAGFVGAGMLYGLHEFSEIGKVAGAVAASQKTAERRMKEFEEGKFAEIKEDIAELKSIVKGEPAAPKHADAEAAEIKEQQEHYRTTHFQGSKVKGVQKIIFWEIALVGLIVGVIGGAVLGYAGMAEHILHGLGVAGHISATESMVAAMTALGAVGASFGINRDIFRQTFDATDMWSRGFVSHAHSRKALLDTPEKHHAIDMAHAAKEPVLYESHIQYPESETHHRDKVLAAGREALMSMDHTKMSPH